MQLDKGALKSLIEDVVHEMKDQVLQDDVVDDQSTSLRKYRKKDRHAVC